MIALSVSYLGVLGLQPGVALVGVIFTLFIRPLGKSKTPSSWINTCVKMITLCVLIGVHPRLAMMQQ